MNREQRLGLVARQWAVIALAAALFMAIFIARFAFDQSEVEVLLLCAVPIAILAAEFGLPGAVASARKQVDREIAARRGAERQGAELKRLAEERRRLALEAVATEEETRRRIAEDLHDGALQTLLAAKQDLLEASAGRAGVMMALMGVDDGIAGLRRAVGMLHPVTFEHDGLASALDAIASDAERRGGFRCGVRVDEDAGGPHDQMVLSLARELLTNAAKHSGASRVAITVGRDNGSLVLEVTDDGCGFDAAGRSSGPCNGHIGLAAAARRARALGGDLTVSSEPGSGTSVSVSLPAATSRR